MRYTFRRTRQTPASRNPRRDKPPGVSDGPNIVLAIISLALAAHFFLLLLGQLIGRVPAAEVGDALQFNAASIPASAPSSQVEAHVVSSVWAAPGRGCLLQVRAMSRPGGALTVQAVRPDGVMMSWAGAATAEGLAACPNGAYLLVDNDGYRLLVQAQTPERPAR